MSNSPRRAPRSLASLPPAQEGAVSEAPAAAKAPQSLGAVEPPQGVPLSILVSSRDRKRLRQLALDKEVSLQTLGIRAWTLLLEAEGLPGLEAQTANRPSGKRRR